MKPSFLIEPEAELELEDAARWYNSERNGLGHELILAVEEVFDNIRRNPEIYGIVCDDIRYARTIRFPYGVFYKIEYDGIVVLSIRHGSRNPGWWQSRSS